MTETMVDAQMQFRSTIQAQGRVHTNDIRKALELASKARNTDVSLISGRYEGCNGRGLCPLAAVAVAAGFKDFHEAREDYGLFPGEYSVGYIREYDGSPHIDPLGLEDYRTYLQGIVDAQELKLSVGLGYFE